MRNVKLCSLTIEMLQEAAKNIKDVYFTTIFSGTQNKRVRERIYTYELYHQLRLLMEEKGWDLTLHGEMDKSAHPHLDIKNSIPDMIIHLPATHNNDLLVLEVKTYENALGDKRGVKSDLRKLLNFTRELYYCGVLLVFGRGEKEKLQRRVRDAFEEVKRDLEESGISPIHCEKLWVLWHQAVEVAPETFRITELLSC